MRRTLCLATLLGLLFGCSSLTATPVGDVLAHPEKYDGKVVSVKGTVKGSANLMLVKGYSLGDEKGQLVVITDKNVPNPGTSMVVRGKVHQAFSIGGKNLLVLIEEKAGEGK